MTPSGSDLQLAACAAQLNAADLFENQVALQPQAIALQCPQGRWTYAELDTRVNRLCALLLSLGVRPGDRVAILSENRLEYAQALLAAAKLGAIAACINWRQSPEEMAYCIRLVEPAAALVSPRYAQHAALFGAPTREFGAEFERELAASADAPPAHRAGPEDGLYILYTSGTTGKPKAALVSHRALLARGAVGLVDRGTRRGSTFVAWSPMFHVASAESAMNTLLHGGKVIVCDGFDLDALCEAIAHEDNLGWLVLMPGMVDRVLAELRRRGIRPRHVDSIGCMADLVPRQQIAEATEWFQAPFRNTFGSTETGPPPGGGGLLGVGQEPENLGKVQSSLCRIRLVDEDGREVAPGAPGELLMRGPTLFSGYWGMPEATAQAFEGGWFHTGDVFRRDAEGRLHFVDRRKYLIKSGGENIYPAEIEQLLLASPRIAEAAVVRKPDAQWGEVPVAFVARTDAALSAEDVLRLCEGKIARYKLPREVRFLPAEEFPRSTSGKVMRHSLEELLEAPR